MTDQVPVLARECKRLEEACLYTSTTFYIWLRAVRILHIVFVVVPLIAGSLATWKLLTGSGMVVLPAILAFIAGVFPAIYSALKLDVHITDVRKAATEFKNIQDRFRQCAIIGPTKSDAEFEALFEQTMARLEGARQQALTPPEWAFHAARRKIGNGHYDFDVDVSTTSTGAPPVNVEQPK